MVYIEQLTVGNLKSNCYIVYDESNKAIIVDPGDDFKKISELIDRLGVKVKAVLLTHAHFDHISAVNEIVCEYNPIVYIHPNDIPLLYDPDKNLSSVFAGGNMTLTKSVDSIGENDVLNLISSDIRVIHTPGHTLGSCCFLIDKILFTGDTLFKLGVGNEFPPYGDFSLEINSIKEKLLTLMDDIVCYPGHGSSTSILYERNNNPYLKDGGIWI